MTVATVETVKQGESIVLTASFKDEDAALFDPTVSKTIRIANNSGTLVVTDANMESDGATGLWKYVFQVPSGAPTGEWTYECKGATGATPDVGFGDFRFYVALAL